MERLSDFDFCIELHKGFMPRSKTEPGVRFIEKAYVVSIGYLAGVIEQTPRVIEHYPYTEAGYRDADAMARRLVLSLEVMTNPRRTGLPKNGLYVDYIRNERSHEEAVE